MKLPSWLNRANIIIFIVLVVCAWIFAGWTADDVIAKREGARELIHEQEVEIWDAPDDIGISEPNEPEMEVAKDFHPTTIVLKDGEDWDSPRIKALTAMQKTWWNKPDENGISNAEYIKRDMDAAREQQAEWDRLEEEFAIEREAKIRAKSAKMLHDMLKEQDQ